MPKKVPQLNLNDYLDKPSALMTTELGYEVVNIYKDTAQLIFLVILSRHNCLSTIRVDEKGCSVDGCYDFKLKLNPNYTELTPKELFYAISTDAYGEPQIYQGQENLDAAKELVLGMIDDRELDFNDTDDVLVLADYCIIKGSELYGVSVAEPVKPPIVFTKQLAE